jgi:phosphatidylserine/phosphatidylglycerophosphate/cardiolipin synthase-like enzyme
MDGLAGAGVELRLLHSAQPSRPFRETFDAHPRLWGGGLQLRQCPRVHFKVVLVDGAFAYLGSANWTGAGLGGKGDGRRNFELGWVTEDEAILDQLQSYYQHVWEGSGCRGCKVRGSCEAPLDLTMAPERRRSGARRATGS